MFSLNRFIPIITLIICFRFEEAYSYFLLGEAIFRNELGPYHFRTLTVNYLANIIKILKKAARNISKAKK